MGCCGSIYNDQGGSDSLKIQMGIKKLTFQIDRKILHIKDEALKLEKNLVAELQKNKTYRAMRSQYSLGEQIVGHLNRITSTHDCMQSLRQSKRNSTKLIKIIITFLTLKKPKLLSSLLSESFCFRNPFYRMRIFQKYADGSETSINNQQERPGANKFLLIL